MKCFSLLLLCLMFVCPACVLAQPSLVVILLPGTSLRDWQTAAAPNLHRLMATGALAMMNTRTARLPNDRRRETPQSAVLTLGAGARAAGSLDALAFLPESTLVSGTTAGDLYQRRVGQKPKAAKEVNVNWPAVLRINAGLGYDLRLGNLAEALASRRVNLTSGGGRFADGVAAGSDGTLSRQSNLTVTAGQCLIWDAGFNVAVADAVIGEAARQVAKRHGRLLVLSPFAADMDYSAATPSDSLSLNGGQTMPAGLLRSSTTHRAGLVANTDFAPTVGAYYGIEREQFPVWPFGHAWNVVPAAHAGRDVSAIRRAGRPAGSRDDDSALFRPCACRLDAGRRRLGSLPAPS